MRLNKDDLYFVVSCIPKTIRTLMMEMPIYLGGGYIRDIICGDRPSDIDLFGPSMTPIHAAVEALKADAKKFGRPVRVHETKNAITVLRQGLKPVQFITRWLYSDPNRVVGSFDFTIAQAVVFVDKPGDKPAWASIVSDQFYADLAAKRLRYTFPERDEEAGGSMLRVVKFLRRGYNISPEDLSGVITRLFNGIEDGSWMAEDGNEPAQAALINGLLREVDPLLVYDGVEFRAEVKELDKELREGSKGEDKKEPVG
jgi:hypothetical protein